MWGFLSDVRESVRQVVAPSPGVSNAASAAVPSVTSTTTNLREMDFEGAVDQVTTGLLRLWRKVDQTASKVLRQAFDGVFSPREEAVPRLFTLKAEALASLPQDELLDIIRDAISQTNDRMHQALNEANFLLSLGIEEQIAHTNDYTGCYEWWDRTVNRRLIVCQDLLQARFNTSSTQKQLSTVMALRAQMAAIRDASTQPMAAIAARGRLLEDERYDLLQSFPAIIPTEGSMHPAPVPPPALDYTLSADDYNIHLPHSQPTPTHSVESVGTAIQHEPYKSPFHPLNTSTPPAPATSQHHANTVMLEGCTLSSCAPQLPTEHASLLPALHSTEEQARLERHAEEERLARAAEEQARLERHAEEERLARAAAEQARLERHAEEERLARAAEEQARLERHAEEERLARAARRSRHA
ncbi:membrane_associated_protein-like_protein [Leishmania braziliensis MHOM/BR/75/M2904]|uniref:Membrane_associated_protein-like_protein n=1 Tax=Leishmania braziliensis MHOM/BR/75/M2904 TaxID=420245 RepID=A0A3P3ZEQ3_LEIBR|nr:membrane_associated_protein-like_protein [Leishmania braziliensis MHOM/BR/75/M2904]